MQSSCLFAYCAKAKQLNLLCSDIDIISPDRVSKYRMHRRHINIKHRILNKHRGKQTAHAPNAEIYANVNERGNNLFAIILRHANRRIHRAHGLKY